MFARVRGLLAPIKEQPAGARRLLWQMSLWWLANALAGTFVNAFLYRSTNDPMVSVQYTLAGWITYALFVPVSGAVVKRFDRAKVWQWGTAAYGLVYLIFLLAGEQAGQAPVLLGVVNGIAQLAFWPANGILQYHVTEPRSRAGFHAVNGMTSSLVGMVVPPAAGFMVGALGTEWGYRLLFASALLLYGAAIIAGRGHAPAPKREPFRYGGAVRRSLLVPLWRNLLVSHFLLGIREGLMLFLPALLVFVMTSSEGALGSYTMVMALLGTAANYAAGWFFRGRVRPVPLAVATLFLAGAPLILWTGSGLLPLLLFSITTTVTTPFLNVALGTVFAAMFDADPEARANLQEYQSVKDVVFVGGRCVAVAAYLLLMPQNPSLREISYVLLVTSAAVVPGVAIFIRLDQDRERKVSRAAMKPVEASYGGA